MSTALMLGLLLAVPGASAAQSMDDLISYTVTPDPWTDSMQGKTASVRVTGKTDGRVPLALLSYMTTGPTIGPMHIGPQKLNDIDRVVLDGRESRTLQVDIPNCFYQVDFIDGTDLSQHEIDVAQFAHGWIKAVVGGDAKCDYDPSNPNPDPEYPPTPPVTPDPNDPQNPYKPPSLSPVSNGVVSGAGTPTATNTPKATARACSAVKATSYRVRAKQRNTITVRVTTTSATKPKVTLKGAGVSVSKRANSKNTAVFRVKPRRAGSIRVTASGCSKVASVKVLSAKRSQSSGSSPTFTG
ncbi:MAG: hypothetical protein V9E83_13210 [Baekduia sp.]